MPHISWNRFLTPRSYHTHEGPEVDDVPAPVKPEAPDSLLNRSTMVGAGQFLEKQNGTALLALHEGRGWLSSIFEGGAGGGVEDLNQIMDHDVYKNSPANSQGKFNIRVSARLLYPIYYVSVP